MLSKDTLLKPMLQIAFGRALGFAMTFMIPVVLVRLLDQAEFGTYKQLFLVYTTLFGIAPLGMAECLYYFLPANPNDAGRFIANSLLSLLTTGILAIALLASAGNVLAAQMGNPELRQHVLLLGLFLALTMMAAVTEIVMIARNRNRLAAGVYTASDAARALCLIVPALVFRNVHAVMVGAVGYGVLRVVGLLGYLRTEFKRELRPSRALWRSQLAYALPFGAAVVLEITQGSLHQFVVAHLYDTKTFAVYSVGCLQIPLVDFVATGAGSVLMVKMGEHSDAVERSARLDLWHEAVRKLALLLFPLVVLLLVAGRELIITLFTQRFAGSVPVFLLSTVAIGLASFPTDSALRAYNQTRFLVAMNVVRLSVVAISISPLLSLFGLPGAALSMVLGTIAVKAVALVRIRRLLDVPFTQLLPFRDLATTSGFALAAGSLAWVAKSAFTASSFVTMTIAGVVYVASYAAAVFLGLVQGSAPAAPAT